MSNIHGASLCDRAAGLRPQPATPSSQSSIPSALLDLATRCEQATGPDRELDGVVAAETGFFDRLSLGDDTTVKYQRM